MAAGKSGSRKPTLRESMALHRRQASCMQCHDRMDPLGLALENFNALGRWREKERGQAIDATGKLITGESIRERPGTEAQSWSRSGTAIFIAA